MAMRAGVLLAIISIGGLALSPVLADRGAIPIDDVILYQESQLAAIAWKDGEEILMLSSSLGVPRMSDIAPLRPVNFSPIGAEVIPLARALEIIPLPSMPEVEEGSIEAFRRLSEIERTHAERALGLAEGLLVVNRDVSVVYHEIIGPHDVTVVRAKDADELVSWVIGYARGHRLPMPSEDSIDALRNRVVNYIDEEYTYFVFDFLNLGSSMKTLEPLIYRFRSDAIYYPLRISGTIESYSKITLFLISEDRVRPESIEGTGFEITYEGMVDLSEVEEADERLAELFVGQERVWLTTLVWMGDLRSLDRDLNITIGFSLERIKLAIIRATPIAVAFALIAAIYVRVYGRTSR